MKESMFSRYARELREVLAAGGLDGLGPIRLNDGLVADGTTMVRLVLADFERVTRGAKMTGVTPDDERQLYDDLKLLHALAHGAPTPNPCHEEVQAVR